LKKRLVLKWIVTAAIVMAGGLISVLLVLGMVAWNTPTPSGTPINTVQDPANLIPISASQLRSDPSLIAKAAPKYFEPSRGIKIAYWEVARSQGYEGPDVYYFHGGPGGVLNFMDMADIFKLVGPARIIAFQQVGSGLSSDAPDKTLTVTNQIEWISALIRQKSDKPVIIIGHSWGSILGARFIARHPNLVLGLIATGPSYPINKFSETQDSVDASRLGLKYSRPFAAAAPIGHAAHNETPPTQVELPAYEDEWAKAKSCPPQGSFAMLCRSMAYVNRSSNPFVNRRTIWQFMNSLFPDFAARLVDEATYFQWSQPLRQSKANHALLQSSWETLFSVDGEAKQTPVIAIRGYLDTVDRSLVLLYLEKFENFEMLELPSLGHSIETEFCEFRDAFRLSYGELTKIKQSGRCFEGLREIDKSQLPKAVREKQSKFYATFAQIEGEDNMIAPEGSCVSRLQASGPYAFPHLALCED
jgi:pimeloyl-ACP methyl ester carboxylesterase